MYTQLLSTMKPKITKVISLARSYNQQHDKLAQKAKDSKDFLEQRPIKSRTKLVDYLNSLSNDEIMLLMTAMYVGREDAHRLSKASFEHHFKMMFEDELRFNLGSEIDRDVKIHMMVSKTPFPNYLSEVLPFI